MNTQQKGFTPAMKQYFGLRPGETLRDFAAELKMLTKEDKQEFAEMLRGEGVDCADPI